MEKTTLIAIICVLVSIIIVLGITLVKVNDHNIDLQKHIERIDLRKLSSPYKEDL